MKSKALCEYEQQIRFAVKNNFLSDELKDHLAECGDCRETQKIAAFFQLKMGQEKTPPKLPTAGFIWWKSQLQKKRAAASRAVKPIFIVQIAAIVLISIAVISLLAVFSRIEFISAAFGQLFDALALIIAPIMLGITALTGVSMIFAIIFRRFYVR